MTYGPATETAVQSVVDACTAFGSKSIVALAGVPGTGKSYIAAIAAQRVASDPLMVREVQFHPSFTYEEFVEGLRIDDKGAVTVMPGVFLEWNDIAADDPEHSYILLVEELTRANLSAVLGELMTYLEYRDRAFTTIYSRRPVMVAPNLSVMATFNPSDRSAVEVDAALLRRMRILSFAPSPDQLAEMLPTSVEPHVIEKLQGLFEACEQTFGDEYESLMPFGHGIFADVRNEEDLAPLWEQRIRHILRRPLLDAHPFTSVIGDHYPWKDHPAYRLPFAAPAAAPAAQSGGPGVPAEETPAAATPPSHAGGESSSGEGAAGPASPDVAAPPPHAHTGGSTATPNGPNVTPDDPDGPDRA